MRVINRFLIQAKLSPAEASEFGILRNKPKGMSVQELMIHVDPDHPTMLKMLNKIEEYISVDLLDIPLGSDNHFVFESTVKLISGSVLQVLIILKSDVRDER